ncbi:hypothetical protein DID80_06415 [Candidatus Marinamargulisbacteria bacterium SCGC AAA071-K20]|nr:hypothetical protein DID80_06415 [Candidatus Marinamargulisbacteria bacterium SCGC AAA071-K20]
MDNSSKLLFIYLDNLTPVDSGSKKLSVELLKYLSRNNVQLDLFYCFHKKENDSSLDNYLNKIYSIKNPLSNIILKIVNKCLNFFSLTPYTKDKIFKRCIKKKLTPIIDDYDIVLLHYVKNINVLPKSVLKKSIVFTHDLYFNRYRSLNNKGLISETLAKLYENVEVSIIRKFAISLVVTDQEQKLLTPYLDPKKILNVGAPFSVEKCNYKDWDYTFLFVGSNFDQNIEALRNFIDNYFKHLSSVKLLVVGNICNSIYVRSLSSKFSNVDTLGYVKDLKPLYESSQFVLATLVYGSGIKLKVLEAMAHGACVIASNVALEGISAVHMQDLINIDKVDNIEKIIEQYSDRERWLAMSLKAQKFISNNFSEERLFKPLLNVINNQFS